MFSTTAGRIVDTFVGKFKPKRETVSEKQKWARKRPKVERRRHSNGGVKGKDRVDRKKVQLGEKNRVLEGVPNTMGTPESGFPLNTTLGLTGR